jgi:predicted LPLAT superfamily acyltransferase
MKRDRKSAVNKSYGNKLGYSLFQFVLKNIGLNWAYGILFLVVPYYVILKPDVYRRSKSYLQRRFPDDSFLKRYLRLFKYIFIFGQALIDQLYFGFVGESRFELDFEREAEILELLRRKPVIFLMSHVGFWEVSMAGSVRFDQKLNVMINQDFDKGKRNSFYDLGEKRFKIINVKDHYGGMIEATNALLRGEAVGVTGDRAAGWRSQQIAFLGDLAQFPVTAQQLAVATGAVVIALFASREKGKVSLRWKDVSTAVLVEQKLSKDEKIRKMLKLYAEALEAEVYQRPYLWFNFFDFWQEG